MGRQRNFNLRWLAASTAGWWEGLAAAWLPACLQLAKSATHSGFIFFAGLQLLRSSQATRVLEASCFRKSAFGNGAEGEEKDFASYLGDVGLGRYFVVMEG